MADTEKNKPEHLAALDSIIEESGLDISREQAEMALVNDSHMYAERLMRHFPELAEGKTAILEGYTAIAMDFPGYTELNNNPDLTHEITALVKYLQQTASKYIEEMDKDMFVLGSAGDELTIAAKAPLEDIVAFALDLQLAFENIVATSPALKQFYDVTQLPKLHFGIARPSDTEIAVKYIETGTGRNRNQQLLVMGTEEAKSLSREFITAGSLETLEDESEPNPNSVFAIQDTTYLETELDAESVLAKLADRGVSFNLYDDTKMLASGSRISFLNVSQHTRPQEMAEILDILSDEINKKPRKKSRVPILNTSLAKIVKDGKLAELTPGQRSYAAQVLTKAALINQHKPKAEYKTFAQDQDAVVAFASIQGLKPLALEIADQISPKDKIVATEILAEVFTYYGQTLSRLRDMGFIKEFEVHDNGKLTSVLTYNIYNDQPFYDQNLQALTRLNYLTRNDTDFTYAGRNTSLLAELGLHLKHLYPFFNNVIDNVVSNYQGLISTNISVSEAQPGTSYVFNIDDENEEIALEADIKPYIGSEMLGGNILNRAARLLSKLDPDFFGNMLDSLKSFIDLYKDQPESELYELLANEYSIFSGLKEKGRYYNGTMILDQSILQRLAVARQGHKIEDLNLFFKKSVISLQGFDQGQKILLIHSGQIKDSVQNSNRRLI